MITQSSAEEYNNQTILTLQANDRVPPIRSAITHSSTRRLPRIIAASDVVGGKGRMTIRGRDCVWGAVIGTVVVGLATTLSLRAAQGAPSQPPPLVIRGDAVPWLPAPGCGTTKFLVTGQQ